MQQHEEMTFLTPAASSQMELSKYLRNLSREIQGKQQLIIGAFAKALEIIPRQLCDNAGIDATDVLNKLRMLHARGDTWAGVDIEGETVADNMSKFVWEPALVKLNAIEGATEAACLVLSVDETVRNPQSEKVTVAFNSALSCTFISHNLPALSRHKADGRTSDAPRCSAESRSRQGSRQGSIKWTSCRLATRMKTASTHPLRQLVCPWTIFR